jgi:hypothetical protein
MTAKQAQISNWITNVRQLYTAALDVFGAYKNLAMEAALTGRVAVVDGALVTNLTAEDFSGANAGLDVASFVAGFAALGQTFAAISDDLAAKLLEAKL